MTHRDPDEKSEVTVEFTVKKSLSSVANSLQNFPANPVKKFGCREKNPATKFVFLKAFGLLTNLFFVSTCLGKV